MTPLKEWLASLLSNDRRKRERRAASRLVAYYWDGGIPVPHQIRDITPQGAYLLTEQRWYPGTIVSMTLQRDDDSPGTAANAIAVQARVVRAGPDGLGLQFLVPEENSPSHHVLRAGVADKKTIIRFLQSLESDSG